MSDFTSVTPSSSSSAGRRIKVLVLHHLGGNGHAMRKRMAPLLAALPHSDQWDFYFADAPYMMPGIGKVSIVDQPGGTVDFGGPAVRPGAPAEMIEKVQKLEAGIRAVSLSRAAEAEAWSEARRGSAGAPQRMRTTELAESRELAAQLLNKIGQDDASILSHADAILQGNAPDSKQGRWWLIRSNGQTGSWMGEEYALAWLSRILETHGTFDACIGFSSGAMMAQIAQALLSGAVPRSAEPTFTTSHPAFKWSLFFSPFVPYDSRYIDYIRQSGTRPNTSLIVAGEKDRIVNPAMAQRFAEYCGASQLVVHEKGHVIPSDPSWCLRLAAWLEAAALRELGTHAFGSAVLARL